MSEKRPRSVTQGVTEKTCLPTRRDDMRRRVCDPASCEEAQQPEADGADRPTARVPAVAP